MDPDLSVFFIVIFPLLTEIEFVKLLVIHRGAKTFPPGPKNRAIFSGDQLREKHGADKSL
jgi:hypothetical protein